MKKVLGLIALMVFAVSCEKTFTVSNGELPAEYVSYATPYVGKYVGKFYKMPVEMTLEMVGNTPVFTLNKDLAGVGCGSNLGKLRSVNIKKDRKSGVVTLTGLNVHFDEGRCPNVFEGKEALLRQYVTAEGDLAFSFELVKEYGRHESCHPIGDSSEPCSGVNTPTIKVSGVLLKVN